MAAASRSLEGETGAAAHGERNGVVRACATLVVHDVCREQGSARTAFLGAGGALKPRIVNFKTVAPVAQPRALRMGADLILPINIETLTDQRYRVGNIGLGRGLAGG